MSDASSPVAGWYADPEDPTRERWWNGAGWSDHHRASTVEAVAPVATPAVPAVAAPSVATPAPAADPYAPPPAAAQGFTFGSAAPGARPDPYAPAPAAGTGYAPSPYVAPYGAPAYGSGSNGLAIAGFATSLAALLLGFLAAVAGIILSAFALSRAKQREAAGNPDTGRGLALAGLIIGIAVLALQLIIFVVYFVFLFSIGYPS